MRSEKVGKAIKNLLIDIEYEHYGCNTGIIDMSDIKTVLDYIRHLENTVNELYTDGYSVCDCRWKNKIKDKIEKLYEEYERFESETIKDIIVKEIQVLKELLEE